MANPSQLWKAVGITSHAHINDSEPKVRFGADLVGITKRFSKGATRCDYVELPEGMNKVQALEFLAAHSDFQSEADQALIAEKMGKYQPKAPRTVKVKAKKAELSLDSIKSRAKRQVSADDVLAAVAQPTE